MRNVIFSYANGGLHTPPRSSHNFRNLADGEPTVELHVDDTLSIFGNPQNVKTSKLVSSVHQQAATLPNNAACGNNKRLCRSTIPSFKKVASLLLLFALSFGFSSQAWAEKITDTNWACLQGTFYTSNWEDIGMTSGGTNYYTGVAYIVADKSISFKLRAGKDNTWSSYYGLSDNQTYDKNNTDKSGWYRSGNNVNLNIMSANSGWVKIDYAFWGDYNGNSRVTITQSEYKSFGLKHLWPNYESWGWKDLNIDNGDGTFSVDADYRDSNSGFNWRLNSDEDSENGRGYLSGDAITKVGSPVEGNKCRFTFAPKTQKITITKILTVTYDANGATGGNKPSDAEVLYNQSVRLSSNETGKLVRTGYTLTGWNTKVDGTGTHYSLNETLSNFQSSLKLYAEWTAKTYTLNLDDNNGTGNVQHVSVTYDSNVISYTTPSRTGYGYKGYYTNNGVSSWGTQVVLTSQAFAANASGWTSSSKWVKDADNQTLYAKWDANTYYVKFSPNGGSGSDMTKQQHTYDQSLALSKNTYTRIGYNFIGWNTDKNATTALYADEAVVSNLTTGTTQVELFAIWSPYQTTVTVNANGGKEADQTFYAYYEQVVNANSITPNTRDGYTLVEYDNEGGNKILGADLSPRATALDGWIIGTTGKWGNLNSTATIYAKWTANTYTITLHYENGTGNAESKSVTFDAAPASVTKPTYGTNVFNGYFTQATGGVQVINADGAFVPNVDGYTSNGNWVKASDVDLYAQWTTRTPCTITYGVTDGTNAISTRGTIRAKIGDGSYTNTGSLEVYTGDVVTIEYSPKSGQYYTSNNGYEANGWYDAVSGGSSLPATYKNDYTFTVTGNASVYVKADPVVYTISTAVSPAATTQYPDGAGTVTPASGEAGPDVALQLTAEEKAGYDWVNWTLSDNTNGSIVVGTASDKTISVAAKAAGFTATANFIVHNYSITYEGLEGATHTNPENYTVESETITLSNPTDRVGYDFAGWTCGGESISQITQGSTGDKTITATWALHDYTINFVVEPAVGGTITKPILSDGKYTTAHYMEPFDIEAQENTGYRFVNWTSTPNINLGVGDPGGANAPARKLANDVSLQMSESQDNTNAQLVDVNGDKTITANFEEVMSAVTTTVNEWGTTAGQTNPTKSVNNIGVTTTAIIIADAAKAGYTFEGWTLTNCERTDNGTEKALTITVKGLGNTNPATVTANYAEDLSTDWRLVGDDVSGSPFGDNWTYANGKIMTKAEGHSAENIAYYTLNVTTLGTFEFKVAKGTENENFYGWGQHDGDYITFNRDASGTEMQVYSGSQHPLKFAPDMAGNYIFKVDYTTNDVVKVTVTYPTTTTYNVDIYYDGVTKTTVEGGAFAKSITAQVPVSMQFDHWVVEGETSNVQITSTTSQTTTFTASGTGAIIRAKFNTNKRIYLKGGSNFAEAYMNFYKSSYWDKDLGTGNTGSECVAKNWQMYKITNTDIFWLDISSAPNTWNNYFSFVNKNDEANNFYMCNVVYREDIKPALPFYVPRNSYANEHHNSSQYFNEGIWMKYNDTYSGYKLHIIKTGSSVNDYDFNAETPGGYEFKTTISLEAGVTYKFKIYNENSTWYGATGQTMTATSCTNWKMLLDNEDCQITTTEAGPYTFVLNLSSGEVIVSVEYPLSANDYRVVATQNNEIKWEGDFIKYSSVAKKDTTSFYNDNYTFQLQQYNGSGWSDVSGQSIASTALPDSVRTQSVINFIVEQDGNGIATLAYEGVYKGNFYIRTDGVDGGWGAYKTNADNVMSNYGSMLNAGSTYDNFQFDFYKAKWINSGKNVKFRIANDYSKAISDEFTTDEIIGNKETLPQDANVRFMWNSKTNQLSRAYISGSTNSADRFLVLTGDEKIYDTNGNNFLAGGTDREGLLANETSFGDNGNWVYQVDIKANPSARGKLTAAYNNQVQYFKGSEGDFAPGTTEEIIGGTYAQGTKYLIRTVYDFKTNRLVTAWLPENTDIPIEDVKPVNADIMLIRHAQEAAQAITFANGGELTYVKTIYGAIELRKDSMVGRLGSWTPYTYSVCNYYVSFPFDVKVSEIFGIGSYGTNWQMQYYDGVKRAKIGWFAETSTFWTTLPGDAILKAHEGYLLQLNKNVFNKADGDIWRNTKEHSKVYIYFPSAEPVGGLKQREVTVDIPKHICGIDRTFTQDADKSEDKRRNHKITDTNWNVLGLPIFQNEDGKISEILSAEEGPKYLYMWGIEDSTKITKEADNRANTLEIVTSDNFLFKAMHGYMVQYAGEITWTGSAITPNEIAARRLGNDNKNYKIELQVLNNKYARVSRTYIELDENANDGFQLNEDVYMMANSVDASIYSFAGGYDVAANVLSINNHTIPLGIEVKKAGIYTIRMPRQFDGIATLIDHDDNTETVLNAYDYETYLNKGTCEGRFELKLEVIKTTPTGINDKQQDNPLFKFIRNDHMYILRDGRLYNANGAVLSK